MTDQDTYVARFINRYKEQSFIFFEPEVDLVIKFNAEKK